MLFKFLNEFIILVCKKNYPSNFDAPKKMKYDISFLKLGFTFIKNGNEENTQCIICLEILASSSFKPSKLERHLKTKHPDYVNKDYDFFKQKAEEVHNSRLDNTEMFYKKNTVGLRASYEVSRKIALSKKPHTIGEQLILPCCHDIISNLFGPSECEKLKQVSLSNNTVRRRIKEMSIDILSQVVAKVRQPRFKFYAIQLYETTDVANMSQLCVYIRYINGDHVEDEFLFCETLNLRTTAVDIFGEVDSFFSDNGIRWEDAVGVCTDGAPQMLGCRSGFQALVRGKCPNIIGVHCFIHRQALIMKRAPEEFKNVFNIVIKAVNYIKSSALNTRLFSGFLKNRI
ncbi:Zinc finger BED domain-containing protein 5 [Dictyocoela muelleri]|nr:Zinc finger BED domain-containing protein 5 [Dictyocoela muelleri]